MVIPLVDNENLAKSIASIDVLVRLLDCLAMH